MTRRTWFAGIAALFAGPKIAPMLPPTVPPILPPLPAYLTDPDAWTISTGVAGYRTYAVARYGLGINVSLQLLEDDRVEQVWRKIAIRAAEERRQREDEMCRQIFADALAPTVTGAPGA
jgi:hypothetical protein